MLWAASAPIIKSAFLNWLSSLRPVIGFVNLTPDVFIYIPIVDTCVSSNSNFFVSTISGLWIISLSLIVPVVAPAGTSIEILSLPFPKLLFKSLDSETFSTSEPSPVILKVP